MANTEFIVWVVVFLTMFAFLLVAAIYYLQRLCDCLLNISNYLRTAHSQSEAYHHRVDNQWSVLDTRIQVITEALLDIEKTFEDFRLVEMDVDYSSSALADQPSDAEEEWIDTADLTKDLKINL